MTTTTTSNGEETALAADKHVDKHVAFEAVGESAETIADTAPDPMVRGLAKIIARLAKHALVIKGEPGKRGEPGPQGIPGPPGAPDLGPAGAVRERLQWVVQSLVEIEASAAMLTHVDVEIVSDKARVAMREGREALVRALGLVAAFDETGVAARVREIDASIPPESPRQETPARVVARAAEPSPQPLPVQPPRDVTFRDDDPGRPGAKKNRRGTGKILRHGDVDEGED